MDVIHLYRETSQAHAIVFSSNFLGSATDQLVIKAIGPLDGDGLVFAT